MNEFVSIDILSTMAGCSVVITLLTQVFKKYLPEKVDTKWLALVFSILIGIVRVIVSGSFDFSNVIAEIINVAVLLSTSIGIYEVGSAVLGGNDNGKE